jgi:hypothetical protein
MAAEIINIIDTIEKVIQRILLIGTLFLYILLWSLTELLNNGSCPELAKAIIPIRVLIPICFVLALVPSIIGKDPGIIYLIVNIIAILLLVNYIYDFNKLFDIRYNTCRIRYKWVRYTLTFLIWAITIFELVVEPIINKLIE